MGRLSQPGAKAILQITKDDGTKLTYKIDVDQISVSDESEYIDVALVGRLPHRLKGPNNLRVNIEGSVIDCDVKPPQPTSPSYNKGTLPGRLSGN